ncbi:hypothetical protein CsSME_00037763 [Camellia sinensis var. sinensis]
MNLEIQPSFDVFDFEKIIISCFPSLHDLNQVSMSPNPINGGRKLCIIAYFWTGTVYPEPHVRWGFPHMWLAFPEPILATGITTRATLFLRTFDTLAPRPNLVFQALFA